MAGVYIHIPFCKSRCAYCGFFSTTMLPLRGEYVDAVCREMALRRGYLPDMRRLRGGGCSSGSIESSLPTGETEGADANIAPAVSTVYVGGGTPSQLSEGCLRRLFDNIYKVYRVADDAEITVECNPDDITAPLAAALRDVGVNRLSLGAQTFSDDILGFLRRRHTSRQTQEAVTTLRNAGFGNISIDLMFGLPGQTRAVWSEDISRALALGVEHISAYSLMYEENTPLTSMLRRGEISETDDETCLAMYDELIDRLAAAGFEHYEISNFAQPGRRSRHNSSYWDGTPYIGIGAAAHSFDIVSRQWNVADVRAYIDNIRQGKVKMERETLDKPTRYNELIMTRLRTIDGLDIAELSAAFGNDYERYALANASGHLDSGNLVMDNGILRLSRKGLFISNMVMSDLMMA